MEHNYGLEELKQYLWTRNYSWSKIPHKKVTLINVSDCKDKITLEGTVRVLMGMGHLEWEALEAGWLIEAIIEAIKNGEETANITKVFACKLSAYDSKGKITIPHEKHVNFLMEKIFEKVEETDDELKVKLVKIA